MRWIFLGKPGSGKGTQVQRLVAERGLTSIATGELIRKAMSEGTALGAQFQVYASQGMLVPDAVVWQLVAARLHEHGRMLDNFLLDGFPRTVVQAEWFEADLQANHAELSGVLYLAVPDTLLVERAVGRRFCTHCNQVYHVLHLPPQRSGICDICHNRLQTRSDDNATVVAARIAEYEQKTAPLLTFYEQRHLLHTIDGVGTPAQVSERVQHIVAAASS